MANYTRRTVVRGAAWTVPVIAIAAPIPAFAASFPPIKLDYVEAIKCPGAGQNDKTYLFKFTADSVPPQGSITVLTLTINGQAVPSDRVIIEGTTVYVESVTRDNSADADGTITITYTSGFPPDTQTLSFTYNGTRPDNALCGRLA